MIIFGTNFPTFYLVIYWLVYSQICLFSFQISDFIVENPGDIPVLIQILPLPLYPNPQIITDLLYRKWVQNYSIYISW